MTMMMMVLHCRDIGGGGGGGGGDGIDDKDIVGLNIKQFMRSLRLLLCICAS